MSSTGGAEIVAQRICRRLLLHHVYARSTGLLGALSDLMGGLVSGRCHSLPRQGARVVALGLWLVAREVTWRPLDWVIARSSISFRS